MRNPTVNPMKVLDFMAVMKRTPQLWIPGLMGERKVLFLKLNVDLLFTIPNKLISVLWTDLAGKDSQPFYL